MKLNYLIYISLILLHVCCDGKEKTTVEQKIKGENLEINSTSTQNKEYPAPSLIKEYGKDNVLIALYFLTPYLKKFKESHESKNEGLIYCSLEIELMINYNKDSTCINKMVYNLSDSEREHIIIWSETATKLNSIFDQEEIYFEEVLYHMPLGMRFFKNYLKNPNQYYGSLDAEQSCSIYYSVLKHLTISDEENRNVFVKEYSTTFKKLCQDK